MNDKNTQDVHGRCYCGAVRFLIAAETEPFWAGYCHCRDCRQAHAAPIYQYVYVEKRYFRIIEGSAFLKWYTRAESARDSFKRFFCERCGSKVYNYLLTDKDNSEVELCGTFPSLFDDQEIATNNTWSPQVHEYCAESIVDLSLLHDDLPRFQKEETSLPK